MTATGSAQRFTFVHVADLHLDTPFKGIGETAPEVAAALREASLDAFDAVVELCIEREAAFAVFAGDIYDGPERGLRAQLRFRDGLARLSAAGIASFVVHGNHDPVEQGWSALSGPWPGLVTVFPADEVGAVAVERDGVPIATVQGISYATRRETRNLAKRFSGEPGPGFSVGVLHCNVQGAAAGYEDYSPCSLDDLRSVGLDYWALGHIHSRLVLSGRVGSPEPFVVYPGNLQARSPKPSELGPKGATVVDVTNGLVEQIEHVACDRVRFAAIDIDITGLVDLGELRDEMADRSRDELESAAPRHLVVRGRLVGRGELATTLRRPGVLPELVSTLRSDLGHGEPFCWWDRVEDASAAALDLDAIRSGGDFAGDLIELCEDLAGRLPSDAALLDELVRDIAEGLPAAARHQGVVERELARTGPDAALGRALLVALAELDPDVT